MAKKILYIDLDNTLVDFPSGMSRLPAETLEEYKDHPDDVPGIFALMDPLPGAVEAFNMLSELFDTYILSTAPWDNQTAWSDKLEWVKRHLGTPAYKRLILSHHKHLNMGDFLVDDRTKNGADRFTGEHIHFAKKPFETWSHVVAYLEERA